MPSPGSPAVLQIGFLTAGGNINNLVDQDEASFWQPYADSFDTYLVPPVGDSGFVVADGSPRPAIQFDFGENVRIPYFRIKVEKPSTVGQCFLIAGDNTATTLNDTVQAGDVWAGGMYTVAQMNSGVAIATRAKTIGLRKRFWRFVFWKQPPAA